jgi:flagellar basal body P-ring formation protein FlgA
MTVRTLLFLVVLASCVLPAVAAPVPRLRAEVTVSSNLVRLGDLIEGAGAAAAEPVFRSPDLGTTGTVQASRILEAARARTLTDVDAAGLVEVSVTRASRIVGLDEMQNALARAIAERGGLADPADVTITLDAGARPAHVEPDLPGPVEVSQLDWSAASGRFEAVLTIPGSGTLARAPLRVGGCGMETVEVAVFTRAMSRGEIIRPTDVVMARQPRYRAQTGAVASPSAAVGLAVRRVMRPGQLVLSGDLAKPDLVQRNDSVTLVYEVPGMTLSIRAKALDAGAEGDTIGVLNAKSNRIVQAMVSGPGRVSAIGRPRLALNGSLAR